MLTLLYLLTYGKTPTEMGVPLWAMFLSAMIQLIVFIVLLSTGKSADRGDE